MFRIRVLGSHDDDYKMVILMRNDLKMGKGKIAAQAAHAAVICSHACKKKDPKAFDSWLLSGQTKVVLKVNSESELFEFKAMAEAQNMTTAIVCDAGRTQLDPGTYTCLGIGPAAISVLDKITGELKML
jgi:PTH2 family peptidyl-tRNA hydrolase